MNSKRPRKISADRETRRAAILTAAAELFHEKGVENVTFGHIARRVKLSRPLVYFYFPDMATLIMEAALLASEKLHRHFMSAMKPSDKGVDQIFAIGRAYVRFARDEALWFELISHSGPSKIKDREHPLMEDCQRYHDAIMGLLVSALQKGMRDGSIRKNVGDPGKVATCLWGMTHGLVELSLAKGQVLEENLGTAFPDLPEFGLDLIRRSLSV